MVPVHRPAPVLVDSGLADAAGVAVDAATLRTRWNNVYAGGDCVALPVSKSGGQAHLQAEVIAHNLIGELRGEVDPAGHRPAVRTYKPHSI